MAVTPFMLILSDVMKNLANWVFITSVQVYPAVKKAHYEVLPLCPAARKKPMI